MTKIRLIALIAAGCVACPPCMAAAQSSGVVQIQGTVFDSVTMRPLAGATVRLFRPGDPSTGRTATSNAGGDFAYDSVATGVWMASFLHSALDSLRLEPATVQLNLSEPGVVRVPLAIPSLAGVIARVCGPAMGAEFGLAVGEVRRATDHAPVVGATVEAEWPEWVLVKKQLLTETARQRARTDSEGRYALCGVPAGSTVRTISWLAADTTGAIEVTVPSNGYALHDFTIGTIAYVRPGTDSVVLDPTAIRVRRGRAIVRGRVLSPTGEPLANATVRVIGSGTPARTTSAGTFTISDAGAGTQSIEARAIGLQPDRRTLQLRDSAAVEVALRLAPPGARLDTVRVAAGRDVPYEVRGIERRWRAGLGQFLDGPTVRDRTLMLTTDALRGMAGVFLRPVSGFGQQIYLRGPAGKDCQATLFVDGLRLDPASAGGITLDEYAPRDAVAAVEVYARPAMVPAEYLTGGECGVVAVWTTFATGNVRILPPKSARR